MIKKLQRKFVAICMSLVALILAVVFLSLFFSMRQNVRDLSQQVLHRVIQEDRPGMAPRPEVGIEFGDDRVALPYFTVSIWGDTAYVTGGTYSDLEDTETLRSILSACLAQPDNEGVLEDYQLRYLRQEQGFHRKLAFVDMSMETTVLRNMMGPYLLIILLSVALLLAVSVLLSRWAVRPVEKAWAQQKQFLSDASHELKTPLTVILSNAELLETEVPEGKSARWTDNILSESHRMKHLVEEMLSLARADNMTQTAPFVPVSLSDTVSACALAFEPVAFEAGKPLDYQVEEGLTVSGDGEKLHRLVSVLLDNAIKYGAEGTAISLSLRKADRQARLEVANAGTPIPPEQLERLFERFYRADDSRGEQQGFGLGLSIAAAIAAEHRGTLRAESDTASTRFLFTLPLMK